MRSMVGTIGVYLVMSWVGGTAAIGQVHAASAEEVVKARIDFMEDELGAPWKVLSAYVKTGKVSLAEVEKSARTIVSLTKKLPSHFPKDTGRGTLPDEATRALPVIWKDWPRFEKEVQRLAEGSERLARVARDGDKDAAIALIGPSGSYNQTKIGCAECHEAFRGPRAKR